MFFDVQKAYDTTWKYGIMKDLRGCFPTFINNYFKVWMGSKFFDSHPQKIGVPQGSIQSVTSVKINSIAQCLKRGVFMSMIFRFATDCLA